MHGKRAKYTNERRRTEATAAGKAARRVTECAPDRLARRCVDGLTRRVDVHHEEARVVPAERSASSSGCTRAPRCSSRDATRAQVRVTTCAIAMRARRVCRHAATQERSFHQRRRRVQWYSTAARRCRDARRASAGSRMARSRGTASAMRETAATATAVCVAGAARGAWDRGRHFCARGAVAVAHGSRGQGRQAHTHTRVRTQWCRRAGEGERWQRVETV